jgi:hypothetical protein
MVWVVGVLLAGYCAFEFEIDENDLVPSTDDAVGLGKGTIKNLLFGDVQFGLFIGLTGRN